MKISSFGKTHPGCVREKNEDAFLLATKSQIFAVADGLGGLPDGDEASRVAVEELGNLAEDCRLEDIPDLDRMFCAVNRRVFAIGSDRYTDTNMATTLTAVAVRGGKLHVGHVGDSAAFLSRNGKLHMLTEEHTIAALYGGSHGNRGDAPLPEYYFHTLTRCIGAAEVVEVEQDEFEVREGDRILLCTDGLTKVISPALLSETLEHAKAPREATEALLEMSIERGAPDNVALVCLFLEGDN